MAVQLGQLALAFALSYIANKLLAPKNKSVLQDDKPTTLSTRGSFIPYMLGRRRMGPIFSWAGNRKVKKEKQGGAKGGPSVPDRRIIYESGWHVVGCNGPAGRLYRILQNGTPIFEGPIDSYSHPSGSEISCGKEGTFIIYWGEENQPINTFIGANIGINSRWPFLVSIVWKEKRLGDSPQWALIDYEFEFRPYQPGLSLSAPWIEADRTLSGTSYPIVGVQNGTVSVCWIEIADDHRTKFRNGGYLKLTNNTAQNIDYLILRSEYTRYSGEPPNQVEINKTRIYLEQVLAGATIVGEVEPYVVQENDGINGAHLMYQLMFHEYPHGCGLDKSIFNIDSLENLGILLEDERIPMSLYAQDGANASAILATLMQDIGVFISWDDGKFRFKEIRKTDLLTIPFLSEDVTISKPPEVDTNHSVRVADRIAYVFPDRTRSFRDMPITIDDDGQATLELIPRARKVSITTAIDFKTAAKIAERRSQEDIAGASKTRILSNRQTRRMFCGQTFLLEGSDQVWRLTSKKPALNSSLVELEALIDYYGQDASTFVPNDGGGHETPVVEVERDILFTFLEVPAYLSPGKQTIIIPRIRDNNQVVGSDLWISTDNSTYEHKGVEFDVQTGGFLTESMVADGRTLLEDGPIIRIAGPDVGSILDLSGDIANWRAGRQIIIFENEICFLRNVTALGAGLYRTQGILRGRFDTTKDAHVINSACFIFTADAIENIQDILLQPSVPLYVKSQPFTTESYPLAQIDPVNKILTGKGIVPIRPANLRTTNNSNSYRSGEGIPFKWTYRSNELARSGAGMQGAGIAVGKSAVQGEFIVRIKTIAGVFKRDLPASQNLTVTYQNSQLITDFGSNPTSFRAELFNVTGGYSSPGIEIIVTRAN